MNPENNGTVKLFNFGKKIYDIIKEEINPGFTGVEPCNVFDLWKGKNFRLKIRPVEGYRNYDLSSFEEKPSVLCDFDDSKLEEIWQSQYKLSEFISSSNFKSAADLEKKYNEFFPDEMNNSPVQTTRTEVPSSKPDFSTMKTNVTETTDDDDLELYKSLLG